MKSIRLYWWRATTGESNFGDELSPLIVRHLSGKDVVLSSIPECDLVAIGSVMKRVVDKQWKRALRLRFDPIRIWGTGSFQSDRLRKHRGLQFFAVRGPLTRDIMQLPASLALGDPGLLVDRLQPKATKKYRWGIIPHVVDKEEGVVAAARNGTANSTVIDLHDPDLLSTIRHIASCDFVVSSSLHGVIAADALGIPHVWARITDGVLHADWKFRDYFLSVGREAPDPVTLVEDLRRLEPLAVLSERRVVEARQDELEAAFRRMNL